MAARTELRCLLPMERLDEHLTMRLGIDERQLVVQEPEEAVVARREIVHGRILDLEVALPHRAARRA